MEIILFTANVTGAMLLDTLKTGSLRPHVITYSRGFQRTGLAEDFSRFANDFPITFISANSHEKCPELEQIMKGNIAVCVDWTKDFFSGADYPVVYAHPSLLPLYRGYSAVTEQFERGVAVSGATFYLMGDQIDGGDILHQQRIRLDFNDYPMDFYEKYIPVCAGFIQELSRRGIDGFGRKQQDPDSAVYLQRKRTRDALIDFTRDAFSLYNHIRAYSRPFFGAYFMLNGQKVTVWKASTEKWQGDYGEPGTVIDIYDKLIEVACGSGTIMLSETEGLSPDDLAIGQIF